MVGASLAGTFIVDTLRQHGYEGELTMLGAEPSPAYHRPALSKGIVTGSEHPDSIKLRPLNCTVDQHLNTQVTGVDLDAGMLALADGGRIPFDGLAIATGARARRVAELGSADLGVEEITFRDLDDAVWLDQRLAGKPRVLIVGAGILGMELASACLDRGAAVTVIDQQPPLQNQLGPYLADLVTDAALRRGVRCASTRLGVRLRGTKPPVAELGDGRRYEADVVISAVGCTPNVEWLAGTGLPTSTGIPIDERCRVATNHSAKRVVAAGDVAALATQTGYRRTPIWSSALGQARTAAAALLYGEDTAPVRSDRYFWTEQFGIALRVCGRLPAAGTPSVLAGEQDTGEMLLQWHDDNGPTTAAALNRRVAVSKLRTLSKADS